MRGAWDNAKKIVEVELKQKGTPLHEATVVGDTVGDPFKDTSSVALNPVIKFTTLFGLLAVELAVQLTARPAATSRIFWPLRSSSFRSSSSMDPSTACASRPAVKLGGCAAVCSCPLRGLPRRFRSVSFDCSRRSVVGLHQVELGRRVLNRDLPCDEAISTSTPQPIRSAPSRLSIREPARSARIREPAAYKRLLEKFARVSGHAHDYTPK